ncbi:hypothetical protein PanWU01x14_128270 [Parasponia andersonii]|uniref:Uncharacterized protein n=1 Tax=Parasponia andersonii TaxID=3476 RepID=A0A2P5CS28_PARAD|nr:hypothetical protein PanWU01x14_128270 [Parasponia andersonii]
MEDDHLLFEKNCETNDGIKVLLETIYRKGSRGPFLSNQSEAQPYAYLTLKANDQALRSNKQTSTPKFASFPNLSLFDLETLLLSVLKNFRYLVVFNMTPRIETMLGRAILLCALSL